MSVNLPSADLKDAIVGTTGNINFAASLGGAGVEYRNTIPGGTPNKPTIRLHSESSSGLYIQLPNSGQQFNLPAGGWQDCYPLPGEVQINYTVLYQLPNPQVTLLLATYYYPGETVPPMTMLGNSSIGIAGSVNTNVTGATLVNTGNAPGTNDIIQIQATGDTGNSTTLDNIANLVNGDAAHPGSFTQYGPSSLDNGAITTDGSGNVTDVGTVNGVFITNRSGASLATIGSSATSAGDVLDCLPGGDVYIKAPSGSFHYQSPNGTTRWSMAAMNTGTVTTSGTTTVNHGLGGTPAAVLLTVQASGSTATLSAYSYTSSQFTLLNGSGVSMQIRWWAYR